MAPGHETPRTRRGCAPRAWGRSPHPSGDVCGEPLRLEGSPETRGVPFSGAGSSQNETCSGGGIVNKSRAGRSTANMFPVREDQSLYNTSQSVPSEKRGSFGTEQHHAVVSYP